MTTISFKAKEELKDSLDIVAEKKGINTSSYIKLKLTEALEKDLKEITPNGLTVAEELEILKSDKEETYGTFDNVKSLMNSLRKNK